MDIEAELAALRATVQHLKDRQDILDVIVRESRGRDRHDTGACRFQLLRPRVAHPRQ